VEIFVEVRVLLPEVSGAFWKILLSFEAGVLLQEVSVSEQDSWGVMEV
jgi:hypothetical protein